MHRLMALLWLRWEYLISNKVLLFVCVVTPFVDFAILQAIPMIHGEMYFLNMGLSLIYSMTAGTFTSMMISEEKEKKNLRTLILSGVTKYYYIISVISFPFISFHFFCFIGFVYACDVWNSYSKLANVFCCSSIDHVSIYSVEFINRIVF